MTSADKEYELFTEGQRKEIGNLKNELAKTEKSINSLEEKRIGNVISYDR